MRILTWRDYPTIDDQNSQEVFGQFSVEKDCEKDISSSKKRSSKFLI